MSYRSEFRAHWQPLTGATVGMALGLALNHYMMSLFGPALIAEFGWSKAQYALIGATPFVIMLLVPFVGRFVDKAGARKAAAVGFVVLPVSYFALGEMTGSFAVYFAITVVKSIFGTLTTTLVFARVVVERFDKARGLALSVVMAAPAVTGALAVPFVADVIQDHGWRDAFRLLGVITAAGGIMTWLMLREGKTPRVREKQIDFSWGRLRQLAGSPVFLLMVGGMFLVNVPQLIAASQLNLVLIASGATPKVAVWCVAIYAGGVAVGRFLCGLALDRYHVHNVALATLGLPAIGLVVMASSLNAPWILGGSVLLIALAQGAEGDIGAYLVSRMFPLGEYSLILSFVTGALTLGSACGSLLLSYTLARTDSYDTFLYISAATTVVGAVLFYMTGLRRSAA